MKIEFTAIKQNTIWVFDHTHNNTIKEPLGNGTEMVLNEYFEIDMSRPAVSQDKLNVIASTELFENYDTELQLQETNEEGSVYLDTTLYEKVWLCPWLQSYFGHIPPVLYVKLDAVNPGLEKFQKTLRTGINPFNKYLKKVFQ
jgi:hypothetical protein